MRGKGKSGATTAAKENAVNTVAKKALLVKNWQQ